MASSWITTSIGEQATLQRGFDITRSQQREGNVPVVSSGGISSYHDTVAINGPGVVLGRKGVVGSVYFVNEDFWPHDTTLWVKDFHGNDRRFVYYFFLSMVPTIASMDVGSANPTLNRNHVHPIRISWPPLPEQRAIAHILGTLDDKIELNRRMNRTLEEMARALFRSWFVDFDPVRAKARGEAPHGLAPELAALFPDRLVETELGEAPEGWSVASLDEIADYRNGLALQKYPPEDEDYLPVIKIRELRQGYPDQNSDKASLAITPECIIDDGDVIFSWSGSLMVDIWCGGLGALNQHLFKVTSAQHPKWFYYLWTQHHLEEFQRIAADKATTMGHIKRHHLSDAKVLVAPDSLMMNATDVLEPILERWMLNRLEARTLSELRDTLLPKLMSGELRVPEAAELAGA